MLFLLSDRQKIREQNMMHARNFGHMTRPQLVGNMKQSKLKDQKTADDIRYSSNNIVDFKRLFE